jgi:hypothetical protein
MKDSHLCLQVKVQLMICSFSMFYINRKSNDLHSEVNTAYKIIDNNKYKICSGT